MEQILTKANWDVLNTPQKRVGVIISKPIIIGGAVLILKSDFDDVGVKGLDFDRIIIPAKYLQCPLACSDDGVAFFRSSSIDEYFSYKPSIDGVYVKEEIPKGTILITSNSITTPSF